EMSTKGLTPDVFSYSTLVNKSPDYPTALKWFEEMSTKGLTPNEISYNTLVNKSPDYPTALKWFEEMKREKVRPDVFTFNTLLKKCNTWMQAFPLIEEMMQSNILPQVKPATYTLIALEKLAKKNPGSMTELESWLRQNPPTYEAWKKLFQQLLAVKSYFPKTYTSPKPNPKAVFSKQIVLELIEEHRVKEAFKYLKKMGKNSRTLVVIHSEWNKLREDDNKGILSSDESTLKRNRILDRLLQFIDDLEE
ncbi:MAG: hypothetical protein KDD27_13275, partial [Saprospiraceae bacterium]|nr:hypothetical protein [Saprospiraceae bacterium]